MITPSFGLTATERVLPKLALDFTTAALDSRVTFTRTTGASNPATYVNSSGVVTAATNNQPRFDYDPVSLQCKGLLIEESRANTCLQSQDPSVSPWNTTFNISFPGGTTTSPDGGTAKFVAETAATGGHLVFQAIAVVSGTSYSYSIFLKANGRTKGQFGNSSISKFATFDLSSGQITGNSAGVTSTITAFPNGWYRLTMTYTASSTASQGHSTYFMDDSGSVSYAGDTSKGMYVWGAQLEAGAFATSYIPTTTTALTRNADVAVMTGTNFSSWFNASEGTFTGAWANTVSGANAFLACSDGTAANYIQVAEASANAPRILVFTSSALQVNLTVASAASTYGTAFTYKLNNYQMSVNTTLGTRDTAASVPTVNQMGIGYNRQTDSYTNGTIQEINYFPFQLTDAELRAFSK